MKPVSKNAAEYEKLHTELLTLLEAPEYVLEASFSKLAASPPYRKLVAAGRDALPFCIEKLREHQVFLVAAALEIWQVKVEDLGLARHANEAEIAAALIRQWDQVATLQWTAATTNAGVVHSPRLASQASVAPSFDQFVRSWTPIRGAQAR